MSRSSALALVWLVGLLVGPGCTPTDVAPSGDAGVTSDVPAVDAPRLMRDAGTPPGDLEGFLDWWMAEGGIYGLAAAVIENGEVVLVVTRGMATETSSSRPSARRSAARSSSAWSTRGASIWTRTCPTTSASRSDTPTFPTSS
jgi:hypothetical protein